MDPIGQARTLYWKHQDHKSTSTLSECDQNQLEADIKRFIYIGIKEINPTSKLFVFGQVLDILRQALKMRALHNMDVHPVTKAFDKLEYYFVLLIEQPWKPEFKKLKMYGGFYRTIIRSVLPDVESIFQMAGYDVDVERNLLDLKKPVEKDILLTLAFDCRVAATQCRTIEQHYDKLKGLDKTVGDAIGDVLHEPSYSSLSSVQTPAFASNFALKGGGLQSPDFHIRLGGIVTHQGAPDIHGFVAPQGAPAIPKREPHAYGVLGGTLPSKPQFIPSIRPDTRDAIFTNRFPPQPPTAAGVGRVAASAAPSIVANAALEGIIGNSYSEILPALPEGTSEDHMRESLRMVAGSSRHHGGTSSEPSSRYVAPVDDLIWNGQSHLCVDGSNIYSALTYPPGFAHMKDHSNFSVDEGISGEMSRANRLSYHTSASSQNVLPNKYPSTNPQPLLSDYGYRTGPGSTGMRVSQPFSSSGISSTQGLSRTIHRPPDIDMDGEFDPDKIGIQLRRARPNPPVQAMSMVRQAPPIPPRELKPNFMRFDQIFPDGDITDGPPADRASTTFDKTNQYECDDDDAINSAPSSETTWVMPLQISNELLKARSGRISSTGRSGSLKTAESKSPLLDVQAQSRVTRSMDLSHVPWQCRSCTSVNVASDNVCTVCSHSRHGRDKSPLSNGDSLKLCAMCTYANAPDKTHCEMCQAKLSSYGHLAHR